MQISNIDYETLTKMLTGAANLVIQNRDELTQIDAAIGDGDHGVTMERVMNIVITKIKESSSTNMSALLQNIAWALMDCNGGATGPLYGSLFLGMSDAIAEKTVLDGISLACMLEGGMKSIMQQSKAKIGDKTMMDALIPAINAANKAVADNKGIIDILKAASVAASAGSEYTSTISAHFGRAK